MAAEWKRAEGIPAIVGPPKLQEPEGRAEIAGIFLTLSPTINRINVSRELPLWLKDIHKNKVKVAFVYGDGDKEADKLSLTLLKTLRPDYNRKAAVDKLPSAGEEAIKDTVLTGSKLLKDGLGTQTWIVKYLDAVMDKHTRNENLAPSDPSKVLYYWTFDRMPTLAKQPGARMLDPVPLDKLGIKP